MHTDAQAVAFEVLARHYHDFFADPGRPVELAVQAALLVLVGTRITRLVSRYRSERSAGGPG